QLKDGLRVARYDGWCFNHAPVGQGALGMNPESPVIHVVDDDESFRTSMARMLRGFGYRVTVYESGDHFVQSPPEPAPGCVLLDVQMSGLNGLQLQDRMAELVSDLPIIFLTGRGDIPTSVRAIKAGAEDFLSKPVAKDKLLE